jgi:hypothetical protein
MIEAGQHESAFWNADILFFFHRFLFFRLRPFRRPLLLFFDRDLPAFVGAEDSCGVSGCGDALAASF